VLFLLVPNLSPSVIDMPIVSKRSDVKKGASAATNEVQRTAQKNGQVNVERVNGMIRKKVQRSKTPKITKLDKEAKKVKGLEPAGLTGF